MPPVETIIPPDDASTAAPESDKGTVQRSQSPDSSKSSPNPNDGLLFASSPPNDTAETVDKNDLGKPNESPPSSFLEMLEHIDRTSPPSEAASSGSEPPSEAASSKPETISETKASDEKDGYEFPWDDRPQDDDQTPAWPELEQDVKFERETPFHIRGCGNSYGPEPLLVDQLRFKGKTQIERIAYGLRMICLLTADDCSFQVLRIPGVLLK
eukprot:Protomagalhaensia_wolfi_Nauph_80__2921@NODE_2_length_7647_cov_170_632755_g1_i0_p6_GENE_NODE_2_length_7647_cov_170_632755_g1_i0NODE_2_length_7647_cov_170_632755_g1_i0_p6_ORF_typecomplete_len212_score43_77_NODE_2_length_7647_cov_170_632755_g1_i042154850